MQVWNLIFTPGATLVSGLHWCLLFVLTAGAQGAGKGRRSSLFSRLVVVMIEDLLHLLRLRLLRILLRLLRRRRRLLLLRRASHLSARVAARYGVIPRGLACRHAVTV